jgi:DNA-directed RNA polymerase alpha subunit
MCQYESITFRQVDRTQYIKTDTYPSHNIDIEHLKTDILSSGMLRSYDW